MHKGKVWRYIIVFVLFETLFTTLLFKKYDNRIETQRSYLISEEKARYKAVVHAFALQSDNFYHTHSEKLAKYLFLAGGANSERAPAYREKMLDEFAIFYDFHKLMGMEGLHVFDREGNSFLRFHEPEHHGDPIIEKRVSLRQMADKMLYQEGLEIGIFKESFRFQFPLFYDGEFIGSYEYGMGFVAISREMQRLFGGEYTLLLKHDALKEVVRDSAYQKRYAPIEGIASIVYLKASGESEHLRSSLTEYDFQTLESLLQTDLPFVLDAKDHTSIFLPLKDIGGEDVAFLYHHSSENLMKGEKQDLYIDFILITLAFLLLILLVYRINKSREHLTDILDSQKEFVIISDGQELREVNKSMLSFFGYPTFKAFRDRHDCICDYFIEGSGFISKEVNGLNWVTYVIAHQDAAHLVQMKDLAGQLHVFKLEVSRFEDRRHALITFHDVTVEHNRQVELTQLASVDKLTGAYNRTYFDQILELEVAKAHRYENHFSLIMFDIDHFKQVNDTYGHDLGDKTLKKLAAVILDEIRDADVFARWGGEEFMLIAHNEFEAAEKFAEKLRISIMGTGFEEVGSISCSFGVTQIHQDDTPETLVKRCDEMLYAAKHAGRNCVVGVR
jgi:diguanylate cyclase (GGDEF)-like protein